MTMPDSEKPGLDELIRDIGRSEGRGGNPTTPERHLMQLAGDPLLVSGFLARENAGTLPPPKPRAPVPGDVTIALARSILAEGRLDQRGGTARLRQYESREPRLRTSLAPSAFTPSRSDQQCTLEEGTWLPNGEANDRETFGAKPLIMVAGAGLLMLLLGLRLVPD